MWWRRHFSVSLSAAVVEMQSVNMFQLFTNIQGQTRVVTDLLPCLSRNQKLVVCVCACSRLFFCECVCLELEPKPHLSQELINYCRSFASCYGQRMNFRMLEKTVKIKRFLYSTLKYKYMMECNCVCWTGWNRVGQSHHSHNIPALPRTAAVMSTQSTSLRMKRPFNAFPAVPSLNSGWFIGSEKCDIFQVWYRFDREGGRRSGRWSKRQEPCTTMKETTGYGSASKMQKLVRDCTYMDWTHETSSGSVAYVNPHCSSLQVSHRSSMCTMTWGWRWLKNHLRCTSGIWPFHRQFPSSSGPKFIAALVLFGVSGLGALFPRWRPLLPILVDHPESQRWASTCEQPNEGAIARVTAGFMYTCSF